MRELNGIQISGFFIYKFHMKAFFFLCGFLFFYTKKNDTLKYDHLKFVKSKFKKFIPSYIFFSSLFLIGNYIFSVDKNEFLNNLPYNLYLIAFEPIKSYSTFLWFYLCFVSILFDRTYLF